MKRPKGVECHTCAPEPWRRVPMLTGDFDFDATIMHTKNRDMAGKLGMYLCGNKKSYGPRTGYNGYHGYSGDD